MRILHYKPIGILHKPIGILPPSLPQSPFPRLSPPGTPCGAPLPYPARPGHAALGRAPTCARALRRAAAARWGRGKRRGRGVAGGGGAGGTLPSWRRKSAFELPIRSTPNFLHCTSPRRGSPYACPETHDRSGVWRCQSVACSNAYPMRRIRSS